ncbi:primosomal protein N' [Pseudolysinimonas sp.]|uniref:primosomal protein N' family DNA-binding protein n=1 Tax=Pseudolysinimonas sp. TaxID=2680009 RepID=UPI003F802DA6
MPTAAATVARVLVDSPLPQLDRLLDYRIPQGMDVQPGVRVRVPLRTAGRLADGYVVELADQQQFPGPLSDVESVVSPVAVLRPEVWRLARAVADRAAGSASDVLRHAIPTRQVRVEKAWLARGDDEPAPPVAPPDLPGYGPALGAAVEARGRVALRVPTGVEEVAGAWIGRWAMVLARLVARTVAAGESAIVVLPDYRDEDQLGAALATLLPAESIVRWNATQSNAERYRGLLRAMGDAPLAVIGSRAAVYAPATRLGLLVIWDDGDPLLAEPLAPYVHARDAALVRQEQQGSALVIAGHTRTTDVERLVEVGWLRDVGPERPRRPRVIPTANIAAQDPLAAQARIPSIAWREASAAAKSGPVLVQVARPGYSLGLRCVDCGEAARCRTCGGPLHQTRAGVVPTCRWCGRPDAAWVCANCGGHRMRPSGAGASRTAEDLGRAFPGVRIVVADGERTVREVGPAPAIVIATRGAEPIAAGGYRAVLLLDGDRMVARASLRVGEDVLRWWSSALSLAADDAPVLVVGVGGALATAMVTGDTTAYARAELADRRALRFPPSVRAATVTGRPDAVATAIAALPDGAEVVGQTVEGDDARAIVRFDYAHGAAVAAALRAEVIRQATARRRRPAGTPPRGRQPLPLRVHLDDPDPFGE